MRPDAPKGESPCQIYLGNLAPSTTKAKVMELFRGYESVEGVEGPRRSGDASFARASFHDEQEARHFIDDRNGSFFNGTTLQVKMDGAATGSDSFVNPFVYIPGCLDEGKEKSISREASPLTNKLNPDIPVRSPASQSRQAIGNLVQTLRQSPQFHVAETSPFASMPPPPSQISRSSDYETRPLEKEMKKLWSIEDMKPAKVVPIAMASTKINSHSDKEDSASFWRETSGSLGVGVWSNVASKSEMSQNWNSPSNQGWNDSSSNKDGTPANAIVLNNRPNNWEISDNLPTSTWGQSRDYDATASNWIDESERSSPSKNTVVDRVYITFKESSTVFWGQDSDQETQKRLHRLQDDLQAYCDAEFRRAGSWESTKNSRKTGADARRLFAARYDEDARWYRARIVEEEPDGRKCRIHFVDFGNPALVKYNELVNIPEKFQRPPFFAERFRLRDKDGATIVVDDEVRIKVKGEDEERTKIVEIEKGEKEETTKEVVADFDGQTNKDVEISGKSQATDYITLYFQQKTRADDFEREAEKAKAESEKAKEEIKTVKDEKEKFKEENKHLLEENERIIREKETFQKEMESFKKETIEAKKENEILMEIIEKIQKLEKDHYSSVGKILDKFNRDK